MRWLIVGLVVTAMSSAVAQEPAVSSSLARSLNDSFADVYEKISPTVVVIEVRRPVKAALQDLPEGFEFFFRTPGAEKKEIVTDQGSGFLIDGSGHIVTNYHVVQGAETGRITVKLKDGRKLPAELIGADDASDLAVIKVDGKDLPHAQLADSDKVRVGQFAFAIGAPFDLPYTFTVGVVSALKRSDLPKFSPGYEEYIQTDASINPGNSGGPLCDIDGRVVGVNTMITGVNQGLGFAVPSNIVKRTAEQLIAAGRVSRPWLGISIEDVRQQSDDDAGGVLVRGIQPNTPAFDSDLKPGDVILKVDGISVARSYELQREVLGKKIGQSVTLDVNRNGRTIAVTLPTAEQPSRMVRAANHSIQPDAVSPLRKVVPREEGDVSPAQNTPHGMIVEEVNPATGAKGVIIKELAEDGAAAASGLMKGDVITEAAGRPVRNMQEFQQALDQSDLTRGVMLMVDRHGQKTFAILKP